MDFVSLDNSIPKTNHLLENQSKGQMELGKKIGLNPCGSAKYA
jgi:hypothetical protein